MSLLGSDPNGIGSQIGKTPAHNKIDHIDISEVEQDGERREENIVESTKVTKFFRLKKAQGERVHINAQESDCNSFRSEKHKNQQALK